jgi:non-ribosomal peptide synthetase-like protein
MVADGLSVMNADFTSTSFRVSRTTVGARNFLGNHVSFPARSATGANCLLATKVMVPIHGEVREGVGLLGSPAFEIPRTVERDSTFNHGGSDPEMRRALSSKNRHNLRTIGLFLLIRWMNAFGVAVIGLAGLDMHHELGAAPTAVAAVLVVFFTLSVSILAERAVTGFRDMTPQFCSIYDPYFWWHERFWKMLSNTNVFNGTPFKGLIWRALGVRVGSRLFDDGCDIPEKTLVTIGDDCTFNAGSVIQCHSQEDGAFKSDHITIGSNCTLGISSWVHYGVTMGDGDALAADSYLMKGEDVPPNAHWGGNPAEAMPADGAIVRASWGSHHDPTGAPTAILEVPPLPLPRNHGRHRADAGRPAAITVTTLVNGGPG